MAARGARKSDGLSVLRWLAPLLLLLVFGFVLILVLLGNSPASATAAALAAGMVVTELLRRIVRAADDRPAKGRESTEREADADAEA